MLFVFVVLLIQLPNLRANYIDDIIENLFKKQDYSEESPPEVPVQINFTLTINNVVEVNEKQETIKIIEWRSMYWTDQRLTWDPANYGNTTSITVRNAHIWKPVVRLHSVIDRAEWIQDIDIVNCRISHQGQIAFKQREVSSVRCRLSFRNFPFDTQTCKLQYESWSYRSSEVELFGSGGVRDADNATFHEWTIINTDIEQKLINHTSDLENIPHSHDSIIYHITFKRSPKYYIYVIILPTIIITLVNVIGVFTPFNPSGERQEKVNLGLTTLLTMTVMLQLITENIPNSSRGLPVIGQFIFVQLSISTAATMTSIIIMSINHRALANDWNIPKWLLMFLCLHKENKQVKFNLSRKHHRKPTFPADLESDEPTEVVTALRKVELRVKNIRDMIESKISDNRRGKLWNVVLDRVDQYLLVVFLLINFIAVCAIFGPVYISSF